MLEIPGLGLVQSSHRLVQLLLQRLNLLKDRGIPVHGETPPSIYEEALMFYVTFLERGNRGPPGWCEPHSTDYSLQDHYETWRKLESEIVDLVFPHHLG